MKHRILSLLCLALASGTLSGQQQANIPLAPTNEDCARVGLAHSQRAQSLAIRDQECMSGYPKVGYCETNCLPVATAFPQCCSIEKAYCGEVHAWKEDNELCQSSHKAASGAARRVSGDTQDGKIAKELHAANGAYEAVTKAIEGIESPQAFFAAALGRDSPLYKRLFAKDTDDRMSNPELGEELFRYAFNQARAGVRAQSGVTNELALKVQSKALDAIEKHYTEMFDQLHSTMEQMAQLDSNLQQSLNNFHPQTVPAGPPRSGADCAIINDPAASRRLLEQSSEEWLALTARCTK